MAVDTNWCHTFRDNKVWATILFFKERNYKSSKAHIDMKWNSFALTNLSNFVDGVNRSIWIIREWCINANSIAVNFAFCIADIHFLIFVCFHKLNLKAKHISSFERGSVSCIANHNVWAFYTSLFNSILSICQNRH